MEHFFRPKEDTAVKPLKANNNNGALLLLFFDDLEKKSLLSVNAEPSQTISPIGSCCSSLVRENG